MHTAVPNQLNLCIELVSGLAPLAIRQTFRLAISRTISKLQSCDRLSQTCLVVTLAQKNRTYLQLSSNETRCSPPLE
jgi:hypothetical protein